MRCHLQTFSRDLKSVSFLLFSSEKSEDHQFSLFTTLISSSLNP